MTKRKIIKIDEEKCNGCGLCIPNCAEGALKIIDGKARLVKDSACDGLGACLGYCPQGAITIEERAAEEFDENTASHHKHASAACPGSKVLNLKTSGKMGQSPSTFAKASADKPGTVPIFPDRGIARESHLANWPVQIKLVPPTAPYFKDADILVAADCVPFAYANFHEDLLKDKILLVGCPKLDDIGLYKEKITQILKLNSVRSVTYAHMEVPCCSGLIKVIKEAIANSGKLIPFHEVVISIKGEVI